MRHHLGRSNIRASRVRQGITGPADIVLARLHGAHTGPRIVGVLRALRQATPRSLYPHNTLNYQFAAASDS